MLITLGDQDIDLSPSFVIFLSTRDPTVSRGASRIKAWRCWELTAQVTKQTVLSPLWAGRVPTRSLLPGHVCQLHSHPKQFTKPVSK